MKIHSPNVKLLFPISHFQSTMHPSLDQVTSLYSEPVFFYDVQQIW